MISTPPVHTVASGCSKSIVKGMASTLTTTIALLLAVNFLFFSPVTSSGTKKCSKSSAPPPPPTKTSKPSPPPPYKPVGSKCPINTLKLGVCTNALDGLLNVVIGTSPKTSCCSLIQGLLDLEAAVCLCTAIKANILGINLNVPGNFSPLLNYCGKGVPTGFQCP